MGKILILIKKKANRDLFREYLEKRYTVIEAGDSAESSEDTLYNQEYDMIITDSSSIVENWENIKAVKKSAEPVFIPVLMITLRKDVSYVTNNLWELVDELILAPIEPAELYARLEILLRIPHLQEKAITDPLTGVLSRGYILERAEEELSRLKRRNLSETDKTSFGVIMLDIDHFKNVNDTYGHLVGDMVLKELAQRMQSSLREYDVIGRYGGEEFLVLIPDEGIEGTKRAAERVHDLITKTPFNVDSLELNIKVSMGVSYCHNPDENIKNALERVDQALYEGKENGRNRIVVKA